MRTRFAASFILSLQPLALVAVSSGQHIIYADRNAGGQNDGTSWSDAYADLHDALALALEGDELWIAAGTYRPDRGSGDRAMFFFVPAGVALYGGFAGWEECLDERDWIAHETILSGDLNADDGPRDCAEVSDCCREHDYPGCDDPLCQELVCDGALDRCCQPKPPQPERPDWDFQCADAAKVACCHLASWRACENSIAVVRLGEGEATTVMDGLILDGAYAIHDGSAVIGGGVLGTPTPPFIFHDLRLVNTVVRDNFPRGVRGGATTFDGCTFIGNGSAIEASIADVRKCAFFGNRVGVGMGAGFIEDCLFAENISGPTVSADGDLTIQNTLFLDNKEGVTGVALYDSNARITDSMFVGNFGGAMIDALNSAVSLDRCMFVDNHGPALSGIFVNAAVRNSVFTGTVVLGGGGTIALSHAALRVENCTFYANGHDDPAPAGIAIYGDGSRALVRNSILRGRPDDIFDPEYYLLQPQSGATVEVSHTLLEGWTGLYGGIGNSGADPMFVDPVGPDGVPGTEDDDLRLLPGSPAINAGDPDASRLTPTDLDGHARVLCGRVDIGAYEFGIGDYNCDQTVDLTDFANWSACMTGPLPSNAVDSTIDNQQSTIGCEAFDFNSDSAVDLLDFAGFLSALVEK